MNASVMIEFVINVISMGSLYALVSLGLVFVFGICKLINFAYGEFVTATAYILYALISFTELPWILIFIISIAAGALLGFLCEQIAFKPFRGRSLDALLVTSFAISIILQHSFQLGISPRSKAILTPEIFNKTVEIFGVMTPFRNCLIIITTVILLVAMVLLMRYTPLGIAMRAASENFTTARLMGVPSNLVISCAFIISGFLAAVVAIFWTARTGSVEPLMGASPLNVAFIAVVIGGMNSLPGAVLGGYIYALIANILSLTLPSGLLSFRDAIMFVIVIAFLILKPEGLLRGHYQEERVG